MSASALTLAAFLALAARCAPGMPAERLAAHAHVESGFRPAALNVNGVGGGPRRAASMDEAVAVASRLVAGGLSLDLGLMQVNSRHLPRLGLAVSELMEPCRNVAVGAAILADADRAAACIYNSGRPDCRRAGGSNGYPEKIRAAAAWLAAQPSTQVLPPASSERRPCGPSWDVWARCPASPAAAATAAAGRGERPAGDSSPPPAGRVVLRGRTAMGSPE